MQSRLDPYLSFRNTAREAMEFYQSVFGGKLEIMTFQDAGMSTAPGEAELVMHSLLEAPNGIRFMASDTPSGIPHRPGASISMALNGDNEAELTGYYDKLSAGGTSSMPLAKAPWGDTFGMCTDKFGIDWLVNISGTRA